MIAFLKTILRHTCAKFNRTNRKPYSLENLQRPSCGGERQVPWIDTIKGREIPPGEQEPDPGEAREKGKLLLAELERDLHQLCHLIEAQLRLIKAEKVRSIINLWLGAQDWDSLGYRSIERRTGEPFTRIREEVEAFQALPAIMGQVNDMREKYKTARLEYYCDRANGSSVLRVRRLFFPRKYGGIFPDDHRGRLSR